MADPESSPVNISRSGSSRTGRSSVLQGGTGYGYAAADTAGSSTPWNFIAAVANDAVSYLQGGLVQDQSDAWPGLQDRAASVPVHHETCTPSIPQQPLSDDSGLQPLQPDKHSAAEADGATAQADVHQPGKPAVQDQDQQQQQHAVVSDSDSTQLPKRADSSFSDSTEDSLAPRTSLDMSATGTSVPHYDPGRDVTLRIEFLTANQTRFVVLFMWFGLTVAMVFLWVEFGLKIKDPDGATRSRDQQIMNLICGCVCLCIMSISVTRLCRRTWLTWVHKQVWKPRRQKATATYHFELLVQYVNIIVFIAANAHAVTSWCTFFSPVIPWTQLVQWTCWNTVFLLHTMAARNSCVWKSRARGSSRSAGSSQKQGSLVHSMNGVSGPATEPATYMDAPLWVNWPLALLWVAAECAIVAVVVYYATGAGNTTSQVLTRPAGVAEGDCKNYTYVCTVTHLQIGLIAIMVFFPILYFCVFSFYLRQAFVRLRQEPYSDFKMGNLIIRLKVRLRLSVFSFFILSIVLLFFVKYSTCRAYVDTWLGLLPLHIAETASAVCWSFLSMPKCPLSKPHILQVWLQEFAWTEREKPKRLATRNTAHTSGQGQDAEELREKLSQQPMFCFETCMNMLYWSALVYDHQQAPDSQLSLEEAMSLYGLTHSELFWEKVSDTKMLMAWNRNTVVCAFRGTASISNAWSDLQAYPTIHMPRRGRFWARPKVHMGFQKCWMRNSFNEAVRNRIVSLLDSGELEKGRTQFFVTGHSLGGALATLAAYAFCRAAKEHGIQQLPCACYTFGAPRTGNRDFAKEYEDYVPDTFHVINDQDAVPRSAKFFGLYKRGGHRIIINAQGDMIVRPLPIEASMRQVPGGMSVSHHLLAAYTDSLRSIMVSQYSSKRFRGGMAGVLRLAEDSAPIQRLLLEKEGWTLADLRHMLRWGPDKAARLKHHQRLKRLASAGSLRKTLGLHRLTALLPGKLGSSKNRAAPQDEEAAAGRVAGTGKGGVLDLNDQEQQDTQAATAAAAKLQP